MGNRLLSTYNRSSKNEKSLGTGRRSTDGNWWREGVRLCKVIIPLQKIRKMSEACGERSEARPEDRESREGRRPAFSMPKKIEKRRREESSSD